MVCRHRLYLEEAELSKPPQSGVRQPVMSPRGFPVGADIILVPLGHSALPDVVQGKVGFWVG